MISNRAKAWWSTKRGCDMWSADLHWLTLKLCIGHQLVLNDDGMNRISHETNLSWEMKWTVRCGVMHAGFTTHHSTITSPHGVQQMICNNIRHLWPHNCDLARQDSEVEVLPHGTSCWSFSHQQLPHWTPRARSSPAVSEQWAFCAGWLRAGGWKHKQDPKADQWCCAKCCKKQTIVGGAGPRANSCQNIP